MRFAEKRLHNKDGVAARLRFRLPPQYSVVKMKILEVVATYAGFFIVCSNASPAPLLNVAGEKRGACNSDNLLRALASPTRLADSYKFCSQYINVPPTTTVTVTSVRPKPPFVQMISYSSNICRAHVLSRRFQHSSIHCIRCICTTCNRRAPLTPRSPTTLRRPHLY